MSETLFQLHISEVKIAKMAYHENINSKAGTSQKQ